MGRSYYPADTYHDEGADLLLRAFRSRATRLRAAAFSILGLIFALLAGGAGTFVFASAITSSDIKAELTAKQLLVRKLQHDRNEALHEAQLGKQRYEDDLEQWHREISDKLATYERALLSFGTSTEDHSGAAQKMEIGSYQLADRRKVLQALADMDVSLPSDSFIIITLNSAKHPVRHFAVKRINIQPLYNRLSNLEISSLRDQPTDRTAASFYLKASQLDQEIALVTKEIDSKSNQSEVAVTIPSLVQTNVTRFGTIILITFLVSILTPLYRYNIRLATYYDARADVLDLLKTEINHEANFLELTAALTPSLDFGKAPVTPTEQILEVARLLAGDKGKKT